MTLAKAQLFEIIEWTDGESPKVAQEPKMTVQFNPASLKVSYSNQVQTDGNNQGSSIQSVGRGDSKLAVELFFDVSGPGATDSRDVRRITQSIAYFMQAIPQDSPTATPPPTGQQQAGAPAPASPQGNSSQQQQRYRAPGLRFQWGTFVFDGILVSMDETLDFWSEDGYPLRATVSLNLSQPGIQFKFEKNAQATPPPKTGQGNSPVGTIPLLSTPQGATLQSIVSNARVNADWKAVASLNGIENPRNLAPGAFVNLNVGIR